MDSIKDNFKLKEDNELINQIEMQIGRLFQGPFGFAHPVFYIINYHRFTGNVKHVKLDDNMKNELIMSYVIENHPKLQTSSLLKKIRSRTTCEIDNDDSKNLKKMKEYLFKKLKLKKLIDDEIENALVESIGDYEHHLLLNINNSQDVINHTFKFGLNEISEEYKFILRFRNRFKDLISEDDGFLKTFISFLKELLYYKYGIKIYRSIIIIN